MSLIGRSSNHNYSLHTQHVFTQFWLNSFRIAVASRVVPFLLQGKQYDESAGRRMSLPSRILYKYKQVVVVLLDAYLFILFFSKLLLEYFRIAVACSVLPFISQGKQSDECTWRSMPLPSQNLYKCKQVVAVLLLHVCCISPFF